MLFRHIAEPGGPVQGWPFFFASEQGVSPRKMTIVEIAPLRWLRQRLWLGPDSRETQAVSRMHRRLRNLQSELPQARGRDNSMSCSKIVTFLGLPPYGYLESLILKILPLLFLFSEGRNFPQSMPYILSKGQTVQFCRRV